MMARRGFLAALLALSAVACGSDPLNATEQPRSPPGPAGQWSVALDICTGAMELAQTGDMVSGTWKCGGYEGAVSGTAIGSDVRLAVSGNGTVYPARLALSPDGRAMNGTVDYIDGQIGRPFEARRD